MKDNVELLCKRVYSCRWRCTLYIVVMILVVVVGLLIERTFICLIGVITEVPITKTKIGSLPFQASYVQIPNHSMERVLVSLYILYIFIQCFLRKTLKQNTIFLCGVIFFSFQRIYIFYLIRHSQILSLCLYQRNRKGLTSDY